MLANEEKRGGEGNAAQHLVYTPHIIKIMTFIANFNVNISRVSFFSFIFFVPTTSNLHSKFGAIVQHQKIIILALSFAGEMCGGMKMLTRIYEAINFIF